MFEIICTTVSSSLQLKDKADGRQKGETCKNQYA